MTKRKEVPAPNPNPQFLTDKKLVEEILSAVPQERIEKLKLLKDQTFGAYQTLILKRIARLEREMDCSQLQEKVQLINNNLARRGKGVNHG